MINADRFIASKQLSEDEWLSARRSGLTATTMAKVMTPAGYREVVDEWDNETPIPVNGYMQFGLDNEPWLAMWSKSQFGTMPNDWLIRHESNPIALATPDGLSLNHTQILEIKTTGKDWAKPPVNYGRQVQWQLYVTGADSCFFVWLLREEVNTPAGSLFVPGWIEPKWTTIERDEKMIASMVETADRLWEEIGGKNG